MRGSKRRDRGLDSGICSQRDRLAVNEEREKEATGWLTRKVPAARVIMLNANIGFEAEAIIARLGKPLAVSPADDAFCDIAFRPPVPIRVIPGGPFDLHWRLHTLLILRACVARVRCARAKRDRSICARIAT